MNKSLNKALTQDQLLTIEALIEELMLTLKIPKGNFNRSLIEDEIINIPFERLKDFYREVMLAESFGNGLKCIVQTAEKFKPQKMNRIEEKAKELIELTHTMNSVVFNSSRSSGRTFEEELKGTKFVNVPPKIISILDNVAPFYSHKKLIADIRTYPTAKDELIAFVSAITTHRKVENKHKKLQLIAKNKIGNKSWVLNTQEKQYG